MVGMVKQTQHNTSIQFYFQINFQLFVFVYYSLHVRRYTVIYINICIYRNTRTKINIEIKNDYAICIL